ncbi:hypothetical protein LINGRAHAP2_LOCUS16689 [Linum grandiflorum]
MTNINVSVSSSIFLILIISSCMLVVYGVETCSNDSDCETKRPCSPGTISVCRGGRCTCLHFNEPFEPADCPQHSSCSKNLD